MKLLVSICLICVSSLIEIKSIELDLEYIRKHYKKAISEKKICEKMISQLSNNIESDVHLAYLGAYQTIWANHTFSPISKLNTFIEGKKKIEEAVEKSPNNLEIRFIRLSIQKNCPVFLGYNKNINQDTQYINKYKNTISSNILVQMINELLNK